MVTAKTTQPRYVLIIEENVHHAELLTEILDRHFAPVIIHTVDTFDDGLDFLTQSQYDLILTAGFTGEDTIMDFADEIVSQAGGTPIIVITGRGDETLAAELTKSGISEYMVKTRDTLDELPSVLKKHLTRRSRKSRAGKAPSAIRNTSPTPSDVVREMETLKEQVLRLSTAMRGWRKTGGSTPPDLDELDKLEEQLKHIREILREV
jgi:DNA-binding NtrC family response regulator